MPAAWSQTSTPEQNGRPRFWRRLSTRLIFSTLTLLVCSAVFSSVYGYRNEAGFLQSQLDAYAGSLVEAAAYACPDKIITGAKTDLDDYLKDLTLGKAHVAFCFVRRADGKTISSYPPDYLPDWDDPSIRSYTAPISVDRGGKVLGRFVLGVSTTHWSETLRQRMVALLLQQAAAFVVVAGALLYLLKRLVSDPIRSLDRHSQCIGAGDLEAPILAQSDDELGRLAVTLDEMRRNLRASRQFLADQNEQLKALDRLKSDFIANMSHEIRSPLSAILGCADLLAETDQGRHEHRDYVDILRRNGNHLLALINDVLDMSKIESGNLLVEKLEKSPKEIIDDVVLCLGPRLSRKGLALDVRWHGETPATIHTDPTRLRQILLNVLENAIKFTSRGTITIDVRRLGAPESADPKLEIAVTDTGIGIAKDQIERLLVPFSQADSSVTRRFGGTGLGLAISKSLAEKLGGGLTLSSEVGKGTRVVVTIAAGSPREARAALAAPPRPEPAAQAPVAAPADAARAPARAKLAGRVLLVDDAEDNQRLLSLMLTKAGLEVEVAENGQVACDKVEAARSLGRPYDLLFMDIQMPVMDGYAATSWIRQHGIATPIVALTAHAMQHDKQRCLDAGCDDYATKPINRAQLLEIAAGYLKRGSAQPAAT